MTSTATTRATPSAIESAVNDDAKDRCSILRQAIFQSDINELCEVQRSGYRGLGLKFLENAEGQEV
jgi:hypothetical protein